LPVYLAHCIPIAKIGLGTQRPAGQGVAVAEHVVLVTKGLEPGAQS